MVSYFYRNSACARHHDQEHNRTCSSCVFYPCNNQNHPRQKIKYTTNTSAGQTSSDCITARHACPRPHFHLQLYDIQLSRHHRLLFLKHSRLGKNSSYWLGKRSLGSTDIEEHC